MMGGNDNSCSPLQGHGLSERPQGSAIVEVQIGAIMTKGRPESYPPAQSLLDAVWCVGHSEYGLTDRSLPILPQEFPASGRIMEIRSGTLHLRRSPS